MTPRIAPTPDGLPEGYEPPAGMHPGEWHLHHFALPDWGKGDLTPVPVPDYAEELHTVQGDLARWLRDLLFGAGAETRFAEHEAALEAQELEIEI